MAPMQVSYRIGPFGLLAIGIFWMLAAYLAMIVVLGAIVIFVLWRAPGWIAYGWYKWRKPYEPRHNAHQD